MILAHTYTRPDEPRGCGESDQLQHTSCEYRDARFAQESLGERIIRVARLAAAVHMAHIAATLVADPMASENHT